jgi:hypothetical protein
MQKKHFWATIGESLALHEFLSDWDHDGSVNKLRTRRRRPSERIFNEGDHLWERSPTLLLVVYVLFLYGKKREVCTYTKMYTYIIQFIFAPFLFKYFVKSRWEKTLLWKKASPFSPKTYQNGENSTAANSTMTDPNGKVSIYLGSSWL